MPIVGTYQAATETGLALVERLETHIHIGAQQYIGLNKNLANKLWYSYALVAQYQHVRLLI